MAQQASQPWSSAPHASETPTQEVLQQIKAATEAFMLEHHSDVYLHDYTFTPMTPNCFLVGVTVQEKVRGNLYIKHLTAERLRDVNEDDQENGQLIWVIDYLDPVKMRALADRHGFQHEVDRVQQSGNHPTHSWGPHSWLDNYLLWHFLFNRPYATSFQNAAFRPLPPGFRLHDPGHPVQPRDAQPFRSAAAPTGGRSAVFLGGTSWRPPLVSQAGHLPGQAFVAKGTGIGARAPMGSVARGGFGAAGRASGGLGS